MICDALSSPGTHRALALEAAAGLALANTHASVGVAHWLRRMVEQPGPLAAELGSRWSSAG